MKNRTYWFKMPRNFGNEYELFWEWNDNIPALEELKQKEYKRITRKEAFGLCVAERRQAKLNPAFSGYAPEYITHYSNPMTYMDVMWSCPECVTDTYILDV